LRGSAGFVANCVVVERCEAEAIYDAGRERCVEVILGFAARCERLEERVARLEEQSRKGLA
jgi:hypothetical protein